MKRIIILAAIAAVVSISVTAQPARRLQEQQAAVKNSQAVTLSERARAQYPVQVSTPDEVSWKRDIYRELDLRKEANAALYYPEEPLGDRVNFFTLIFNLIIDGKIPAYEYRLDGNELFNDSNKVDIPKLLDKFYIYYQEKDGKYIVAQTDIPSSEIQKYYIKESNFLDQHTSGYQTRVTAVCPVQMRQDIGTAYTQYPMFWLNYEDLRPYLAQVRVMTSSLNNTTNMSLDDYFAMRCYNGEIYKTSNLRNVPLSEYCETDTLLKAEQQHIEQQLVDFEAGLWASQISDDVAANDSIAPAKGRRGHPVAEKVKAGHPVAAKAESAVQTVKEKQPVAKAKENAKEKVKEKASARAPKAPRQPRSSSSERVSLQRTR